MITPTGKSAAASRRAINDHLSSNRALLVLASHPQHAATRLSGSVFCKAITVCTSVCVCLAAMPLMILSLASQTGSTAKLPPSATPHPMTGATRLLLCSCKTGRSSKYSRKAFAKTMHLCLVFLQLTPTSIKSLAVRHPLSCTHLDSIACYCSYVHFPHVYCYHATAHRIVTWCFAGGVVTASLPESSARILGLHRLTGRA